MAPTEAMYSMLPPTRGMPPLKFGVDMFVVDCVLRSRTIIPFIGTYQSSDLGKVSSVLDEVPQSIWPLR
jgi:hypothetical protein